MATIDIKKFDEEIKNINRNSWGYGNEILYLMAKNPNDLTDKNKLSGAIWLIGRAYAASPQRRSYGIMENTVGYINLEGNEPKKCPIWPVRTQDDGREGFFDEIASGMEQHFENLIDIFLKNPTTYSYDRSDSDINLLTVSISAVLRYNLFLSESLEDFDEVPKNNEFNGHKVYCSNHISFASKFLHFYFPHSVFIIDNYARAGGKLLFDGYDENKPVAFYDAPTSKKDAFEEEIYQIFSKDRVNEICNIISSNSEIRSVRGKYNERAKSANFSSEDNYTVKDYMEHCVRSYLLGCHIKKAGISPINQIKYVDSYTVKSMPRLTDSVFLNIKAPISKKVKDHCESLKKIYKISYRV